MDIIIFKDPLALKWCIFAAESRPVSAIHVNIIATYCSPVFSLCKQSLWIDAQRQKKSSRGSRTRRRAIIFNLPGQMIPELQSLYRGGEGLLSLSRSARKWPFAQSPLTRKVANATQSEKKIYHHANAERRALWRRAPGEKKIWDRKLTVRDAAQRPQIVTFCVYPLSLSEHTPYIEPRYILFFADVGASERKKAICLWHLVSAALLFPSHQAWKNGTHNCFWCMRNVRACPPPFSYIYI
jgi:hypothetical protein